MEFRIDQMLLVVAVIVATLFDLLVRWQRRKRGGAPLPDAGDRWVVVDAEEEDDDEADERLAITTREPERSGAVTYRPPSGASPSPVDRQPTYRSPRARSVTFGAPIEPHVREPATGPARANARRRGRSRGWTQLRNGTALKRAIVLAEILGPCRGWQRPGEGEAGGGGR